MAFLQKNKKWLGYVLYVILVTLGLLYYLFPDQTVREFIDNSLSRVNPQLGFAADSIGPHLPVGLNIDNGRVFLNDTPGIPVFTAESLTVSPRVLQFLKGSYSFDLKGKAYGGSLTGDLKATDADGEKLAADLTLVNLDLADYGFLAEKLKHKLLGKLNGNISFNPNR